VAFLKSMISTRNGGEGLRQALLRSSGDSLTFLAENMAWRGANTYRDDVCGSFRGFVDVAQVSTLHGIPAEKRWMM
jgi:hypothetical protein